MISIVLLFIAVVCFCIHKTKGILWGRNRQSDEPPVVPGHALWGNGQQFNDNSIQFILDSQRTWGDVFSIRMLHYYMTVIADAHSFETFSKEKSFDFEPIQEQVNGNIFGFQVPEPKKMIKVVGKTTRGSAVVKGLHDFSGYLDKAYTALDHETPSEEWVTESLDHLANRTLFKTIFSSIFGDDKETPNFNYKLYHDNIRVFHKYFSYLWLGLPHCFFPEATEAVSKLFDQPSSSEFINSEGTSDYLREAIKYLQSYNMSEKEIQSHNLVFLHININTFKIATWCLYQLMNHKAAMTAVREELDEFIQTHKGEDENEEKTYVTISAKDLEQLESLDSLVTETFRMASGVFMIRHNQQDTQFKAAASGKTYKIRAGDKVMMYPPAVHKDPEIFDSPEEFQYDRFINKSFFKNGMKLKNPVLPFGSICPGRKIALLQTKWYIVSMLQKFDIELLEGESCDFDTSYPGHEIVPATNDVQMRYKARNSPIELRVRHEC